jgi:hypothetical protein
MARCLGTGLAAAHPWKEEKAFTLNLLRGFGFGKTYMESTIADEAKRWQVTNKLYYIMAHILLKVASNTITLTLSSILLNYNSPFICGINIFFFN